MTSADIWVSEKDYLLTEVMIVVIFPILRNSMIFI